jgi:hypothetical protein
MGLILLLTTDGTPAIGKKSALVCNIGIDATKFMLDRTNFSLSGVSPSVPEVASCTFDRVLKNILS